MSLKSQSRDISPGAHAQDRRSQRESRPQRTAGYVCKIGSSQHESIQKHKELYRLQARDQKTEKRG